MFSMGNVDRPTVPFPDSMELHSGGCDLDRDSDRRAMVVERATD